MTLPHSQATERSPFPTSERLWNESRERRFILDGDALGSLACNQRFPRLWSAIPPYNAQCDPHTRSYFRSPAVQAVLRRSGQGYGGTSAYGRMVDYNFIYGPEQRYFIQRNWSGAGHCKMLILGHNSFIKDDQPMVGYNGRFGYRRNIPSLRNKSSCFGEISPFSFH